MYKLHNVFVFQVASFADWIKCTKKNAEKAEKTHKAVEQACDNGENEEPFKPRCDHEELFYNNEKPDIC